MSEEKDVDIVSEPLPKKERVKDARRVAAGLALAQKNREARAALAREKARESAREASEPESADSSEQVPHTNTLSSLSWQHFIGLGGLIIGAGGLYLQWRKTTPTPVTEMPSRVEPRIEKHNTPPMV